MIVKKGIGEIKETDQAVATLITMIENGLDPNEETVQVLTSLLAKSKPVLNPYQQQRQAPDKRHKH